MKIKTKLILLTMTSVTVSLFVLVLILVKMLPLYDQGIAQDINNLFTIPSATLTLTIDDITNFQERFKLVVGTSIVIILSVCLVLTNSLIKKLLQPIGLLRAGADRINQNNLSEPIIYNRDDEFKEVCITFNDMQTHLLQERVKLAEYEKARIDMIAGISHDLRTPLTSVKGYIKGIRDGVANTPEKQKEYLEIAYKKTDELDSMLTRLFNISKLKSGNLLIRKEKFELRALLNEYTQELMSSYTNIKIDVVSEKKHYIEADIEQICQLFSNLVTNAIKYSKTENLKITITLKTFGDSVKIIFADNGVGVPESQLNDLFKQFWRGDKSRSSSNPKGSGLGLYIVESIIEAHNGSCKAYNKNGLTIEMVLPSVSKGEY